MIFRFLAFACLTWSVMAHAEEARPHQRELRPHALDVRIQPDGSWGLPPAKPHAQSAVAAYEIPSLEATKILGRPNGLSLSQVVMMCRLARQDFPLRILVRPSRFQKLAPEFRQAQDIVVLAGERHTLPASYLESMIGVLVTFQNFAYENIGRSHYRKVVNQFDRQRFQELTKLEPQLKGQPVPSVAVHVPEEQEVAGMSQLMNVMAKDQPNVTRLDLEAGGRMNFFQRRQLSRDLKDMDADQTFAGDVSPIPKRSRSRSVRYGEELMAAETLERGRPQRVNALVDVRNGVMGNHLEKNFRAQKEPLGPVLVAVGALHVPGLKYELVAKGFREVSQRDFYQRCHSEDIQRLIAELDADAPSKTNN